MSELQRIELIFESLDPVPEPDKVILSVGTVTLLSDQELRLDFNQTSTSCLPKDGSFLELRTTLSEFEWHTYQDEYEKIGIAQKDLNYFYFASRIHNTYITEVFAECFTRDTKQHLPLTLKGIQLHFAGGLFLDYSKNVSIFALAELVNAA